MQIVSVADNHTIAAWDEHNNAKYVGNVQSVDSMMLKNFINSSLAIKMRLINI